nr:hypothetical protein [Tanacetum cinerariifolium]
KAEAKWIFISQDKYVAKILRKFGLRNEKSVSTPIDTEKLLLKDHDGEDVDAHTYRSMIGSLMYLTSSKPDIMFAVCACAHFQVTSKASHLHAVKRIFGYLKGKPHLGLRYPKDSPFNLVAYSDNDYAGASLDRKSTTGGFQFLRCRLISCNARSKQFLPLHPLRLKAIILFLAYASFMGFIVYQMDIKSAFLYGTIDEEVYVMQPPGFQDPKFPAKVYKVEKAMYGLQQALRAWYGTLSKYLLKNGFQRDSEQRTHEFMHVYLAFAIVYGEFNVDFHPMVDFIEASPLRYALTVKPTVYVSHIQQFWSTARIETTDEGTQILAIVDGITRTITESSLRRNLKLQDKEGKDLGTPTEPHHTPSPEAPSPSHTTYTSPSLPPVTSTSILTIASTETTPIRQYTRRARIAQSSALPTVADEPASSQRDVSEGEACPTNSGFIADQDRANIAKTSTLPHESTSRSELVSKFAAQALEITELKARVKFLEDRQRAGINLSGDDAPIKGRSLTLIPLGKDLGTPTEPHHTPSPEAPSPSHTTYTSPSLPPVTSTSILTIASTETTPIRQYTRRARIAQSSALPTIADEPASSQRDVKITELKARVKFLEDRQRAGINLSGDDAPIKGRRLDEEEVAAERLLHTQGEREKKMVETHTPKKKKRVQEQIDIQFARELEEELEREDQRMNSQIARDEEIAKIHAEEELQQMISGLDRSNETIPKHLEEYNQAAAELIIRERIELISELESAKKQKISEEVLEEVKSSDEVLEEKIKELIQLVPNEEVYVESLQVKHPIIKWKIDREDLNQLWALVKKTLELKRLYELDVEDHLWTHTQHIMHAPIDWMLYDTCGVHHVMFKDLEIFMLVEKN